MHGVPPCCLACQVTASVTRLRPRRAISAKRMLSTDSGLILAVLAAILYLGIFGSRLHCSARGVCLYTTTRHTAALEYQNYGIPATPTRRYEAAPPTAQRHAASKSHPSEDQTVGCRPLRVSDIGTHSFRHQAADLIPLQRARRALSVLPHRAPHCTGTAPFP